MPSNFYKSKSPQPVPVPHLDVSTAVVNVESYWYVVQFSDGGWHKVSKSRECTCSKRGNCPAVRAVLVYLQAGGKRAPEPPNDVWLKIPSTCPICNGKTVPDASRSFKKHGLGWDCEESRMHYWMARLSIQSREEVIARMRATNA